MSDWFRSMFEPPKPPDCDECQTEPDWYRMGLTPPATRSRNLSKVDPHRFLDQIVELREGYGADDADLSSGETVAQFLESRAAKSKKGIRKATLYSAKDGAVLGDISDYSFTLNFTHPLEGGSDE